MKRTRIMVVSLLCAAIMGLTAAAPAHAQQKNEKAPLIQLAILLDTSSSMNGLIAQAKTQLWQIVNELATAKRDARTPELHVALYEYGNDRLSAGTGHVRRVLPLTTDLDKVSEELFALKTNGGFEYCGWVIGDAVKDLAWSASDRDLKVIFIAGNEAFTQGEVDYRKTCRAAIEKSIIVNTIHCGDHAKGVRGKWDDGARLADGAYSHIDQNRKIAHIAAPQDEEIQRLGAELNGTYIAYGKRGEAGAANQIGQDANAVGLSLEVNVQRQLAKASVHYRNGAWDLVDAVRDGQAAVEKLSEDDLPKEMQKMSPAERKAYVAEQQAKRSLIQQKIRELSEQRKKFVAQERKKLAEKGEDTFDIALIKALRVQAEKREFTLDK